MSDFVRLYFAQHFAKAQRLQSCTCALSTGAVRQSVLRVDKAVRIVQKCQPTLNAFDSSRSFACT
jgi:hypothetical protein